MLRGAGAGLHTPEGSDSCDLPAVPLAPRSTHGNLPGGQKGAEDPDPWSWGYLGSWVIRNAWARSASLRALRAWKPEGLTRPAPVGRATAGIGLM